MQPVSFFPQIIIAKKFMGEPRAAKSQSASSTGAEKGKNKEKRDCGAFFIFRVAVNDTSLTDNLVKLKKRYSFHGAKIITMYNPCPTFLSL